jgi:predicted metal-dependent enzyme (double-stranded beta helix superfamily)/rhodanese-related sulfurtransferase
MPFASTSTFSHPHPRLLAFVASLASLINRKAEESTTIGEARVLLQALVSQSDWLPPDMSKPNPDRYQQYLLYVDPKDRFSVVSFVWGPGQSTPIHNHTVWGLVGMLSGSEGCQNYEQNSAGQYIPVGQPVFLKPGQVEAVSPTIGDVHKVWNALKDQSSVSIHVYGGNIGKINRSVFHEDGNPKSFVSGYSNPLPAWQPPEGIAVTTTEHVRTALLDRQEIALLDVREEDPFAQSHPLFAANMPLGRLEADAWQRIPRLNTPVVVYDDGEGYAQLAVERLKAIGYTQVSMLQGGLQGWHDAGGELFQDVNVPSKSFGELVESIRHTPSLSAKEVKALIDSSEDMVVLDARRFDEYQTMSIPTGISVPGAELVLRAAAMAPNPQTKIIVNCAGRTRSIIGTQSLVNAGIPNPVAALRNGTIGWTLAGQALEKGAQRRFCEVNPQQQLKAAQAARAVADQAGVGRVTSEHLKKWLSDETRTTYLLDVRTPEEYRAGHFPGAISTPGGQLVQETDHTAPVRGARLVLMDTMQARADMSASWLAQMGWDVHVLEIVGNSELTETRESFKPMPGFKGNLISAEQLQHIQSSQTSDFDCWVIDLSSASAFVKAHISDAFWMIRSTLAHDLKSLITRQNNRRPNNCILTCTDGRSSVFAIPDVQNILGASVKVSALEGGNAAWHKNGYRLASGHDRLIGQPIDRYRRPYEGTQNAASAMQAYLDWEFGLVEQLSRDGSHGFKVI